MQGIHDPATQRGIIPRSFEHIFEAIDASENMKYLVHASYLEIYNEEIRDLLGVDIKKKLELKEHPDKGVYVPGKKFEFRSLFLENHTSKGNRFHANLVKTFFHFRNLFKSYISFYITILLACSNALVPCILYVSWQLTYIYISPSISILINFQ